VVANPTVHGEFSFITGLKFTIKFDRMQTIANALEKCNQNFTRFVNGIAGVQFFRRQDTPGVIASVDTPFIVRRFPASAQASRVPVETDMLELGIMLIEVWEQRTFEEWTAQEGLGASSDHLERTKRAIRWMETVTDPMMVWYEDAVSVCLRFDFGNLPRDWEDARFRQGYCEKVILPLFKTCNAWERRGR
jgi:hypothetical protein